MKTYIFLPPVSKPTGGVTVLRQMADILHQAGREARLVEREGGSWRPEGLADAAPVLAWNDLRLAPDDLWLVPEGWPNALAPGLEARSRCVVYVQNWAYLFSALPPGVAWSGLPVSFLAVSDPVAHFIRQATRQDAPVLRPGIDRAIFRRQDSRPTAARDKAVTVAFMPRKNKGVAAQIRAVFEHRNGPGAVRWLPIEGLDAFGVAKALNSAHIFLMTGFPEGCPLPPLEAMACGCLPVGFTGLGGWDYMRQVQADPRFMPWWPLREVAWSGNGLWCADGDVLDAALCLEQAADLIREGGPELDAVLAAGQETASAYSTERQRKSVLALWDAW
ncbi:glycosyltransferase family 1 protein [Pseudodesulfovibrio sp. F-1]|uniref:Glycosyltransferase family 1 protein n=1 Tax=Pseudodesulfovibrio alkaliphilus TaxID=2661613 RepID=A0A7K1KL12_9BACT|nr:glycosyltransferase family 1 protein [Pseudodesulfovibrio alkaliphilus]MUM76707.1 glycosyltransferase family 1 protein [Pseudodesulfovibrio alkaliphilus]